MTPPILVTGEGIEAAAANPGSKAGANAADGCGPQGRDDEGATRPVRRSRR